MRSIGSMAINIPMTLSDLAQLSAQISNFSRKHNYRWKACPVICWEFATLNDYFHARADLEQAICSEPYYAATPRQFTRTLSPDTCELDCYGVTFRLTCLQRMMTPAGERGANQLTVTCFPSPLPSSKPTSLHLIFLPSFPSAPIPAMDTASNSGNPFPA